MDPKSPRLDFQTSRLPRAAQFRGGNESTSCWWFLSVLLAALLVAGCGREEPQPLLNENLGDRPGELMPPPELALDHRLVEGGRAQMFDPESYQPPDPPAEPTPEDAAGAEGAVSSYTPPPGSVEESIFSNVMSWRDAVVNDQLDDFAGALIDEQQQAARDLWAASDEWGSTIATISDAVEVVAPDVVPDVRAVLVKADPLSPYANIAVSNIEPTGETEATVSLAGRETTFRAMQVDGAWRLSVPAFEDPAAVQAQIDQLGELRTQIQNLAADVQTGSKTPQQSLDELRSAVGESPEEAPADETTEDSPFE